MKKHKILLADDSNLCLELERSFFADEHFTVIVARNGREAFEKAALEQPDMIFLDLYMPEMDGDACCQLIKRLPNLGKTPVVIVTKASDEDYDRCRKVGCDEIIAKPVSRSAVLETVERFLDLSFDDRQPRFDARIFVCFGSRSDQMLTDYTVNISTGGVFIQTEHIVPEGTELSLDFYFTSDCRKPVHCQGRVAWVNRPDRIVARHLPPGMGIQFLNLSLEDMWAIREFIRNAPPISQDRQQKELVA